MPTNGEGSKDDAAPRMTRLTAPVRVWPRWRRAHAHDCVDPGPLTQLGPGRVTLQTS